MKRETGYQKGLMAEMKAALWLRRRGYKLLAWRYKTKRGEIDLIALEGNTLVFVEVKQRASLTAAAEAIDPRSRQRIWQAAELYLQAHPQYTDCDMRFDAIMLAAGSEIQHLPSAWGH